MMEFIFAAAFLPALCLCFYISQRIINHFVEKQLRKERLRIIHNRRRELAIELSKCA